MQLAIRILSYLLAAFLVFMGAQKFIGDVPIFAIIEANTGLGFVEPAFKYLTGALELAAAGLLVLGRRFIGGGLAALITAGAVGAHLTVLGISTPMAGFPDGVTAASFQCGEAGIVCSPMLFVMALGALVASAVVVFTSRAEA